MLSISRKWKVRRRKIRKYSSHSSRLLFIIDLIITLIYSVRSSRESCIYSPIWNCKKHPLLWLLAGNNNGFDKLVIQVRYLTKHKKMKDKIPSPVKTKINDIGMRQRIFYGKKGRYQEFIHSRNIIFNLKARSMTQIFLKQYKYIQSLWGKLTHENVDDDDVGYGFFRIFNLLILPKLHFLLDI